MSVTGPWFSDVTSISAPNSPCSGGKPSRSHSDGMDYPTALLTAFGCGIGFFMAMVSFSGVRSRVEDAEPPASFEGLPITLVSAAIVSLSFFGFSGVLDRLFG